jgi:hypothetical protein
MQRAIAAMINCRVATAQQHLDSAAEAASEATVEAMLARCSVNGTPEETAAAAVAAVMQFVTGGGSSNDGDQVQQLWTRMSGIAPDLQTRQGFSPDVIDSALGEAKLAAERCMGCVTPQLLQQLLLVLPEVSSASQTTVWSKLHCLQKHRQVS